MNKFNPAADFKNAKSPRSKTEKIIHEVAITPDLPHPEVDNEPHYSEFSVEPNEHPSIAPNSSHSVDIDLDGLTNQEITYKILGELIKNHEYLDKLSGAIADKLQDKLHPEQLLMFINTVYPDKISSSKIKQTQELKQYTDALKIAFNNMVSNIITEISLKG